jgi:hypothetical protein
LIERASDVVDHDGDVLDFGKSVIDFAVGELLDVFYPRKQDLPVGLASSLIVQFDVSSRVGDVRVRV